MPVVIRENMRETVDIRVVYKLGYMLETPIESCATRSGDIDHECHTRELLRPGHL